MDVTHRSPFQPCASRCLGAVLIPALLSIVLVTAASADPRVTAEWNADVSGSSSGGFGGTGFSQARGQSFEAMVDGRVTTIELRVARNGEHAESLVVELFEVDGGGEPQGAPLMSGTFVADGIPVDVITSATLFAFDDGAMVTAGERYAVTFRPLELDAEGNNYYVNGSSLENATYERGNALRSADGGVSWIVETVLDWGFRIMVDDATPVLPATWGGIKRLYDGR